MEILKVLPLAIEFGLMAKNYKAALKMDFTGLLYLEKIQGSGQG